MIDEAIETEEVQIPNILPLLPVKDIVVFPYMILPLFVGREISIAAVEKSLSENRLIFLTAQKDGKEEDPAPEGLYRIGTVAMIMKMLKLPDGRVKILVQGLTKGKIVKFLKTTPYFSVKIKKIPEPQKVEINTELEALIRNIKDHSEKILSLKGMMTPDVMVILENINDPGRLADLVASNLRLKISEAQEILEIDEPMERLRIANELLTKELEVATMQARIQSQAKEEMSKTQREYFLREQLKAIKSELGDVDEQDEELDDFRVKIKEALMPEKVEREAFKQLKRLGQMHPESAEATVIRTYLEWMVDLPWSKFSQDNLDINAARDVLDEDHYDLEKVKERILEYLAVRKLKDKMKGPILCFVGPPGVGKTSLGKSIARSLGREFVRISLGGVRDEAEIRGHRRTYIGAMPGRIMQGIRQAGTNNPVFMMDEIDKLGADFRGDPSSALLEVLDPEQNFSFSDHYLNVPFDLSGVMFITTANLTDPIPSALKDRMEIIEISGYTDEEKLLIAKKFLIPRQKFENGLKKAQLKISDEAILNIINLYTRESGVRNLEREVASICRKVARKIAEGKAQSASIGVRNLHKYLGAPKFLPDVEQEKDEVGLATGLAWTPYGGEVIYVETSIVKGKGNLILTGQLGDVMKESAQAALTYARSLASELNIDPELFEKSNVHVHIPAGAIPKDGPSAGITMAVSMISALAGVPANKDVAMTGEITLRGRVLPIGGLKVKVLAAIRAGVKKIIVPHKNRKDLEEIPENIRSKVDFVFVNNMDEVIPHVISLRKARAMKKRMIQNPMVATT